MCVPPDFLRHSAVVMQPMGHGQALSAILQPHEDNARKLQQMTIFRLKRLFGWNPALIVHACQLK